MDWIEKALELGFTAAAPLDPAKLEAREVVRDACAADKCQAYDKNWTCPPACGTLQECQERMHQYTNGILLQTTGQLAKRVDTKGYARIGEEHIRNFYRFAEEIRKEYPEALCLGAGGCRICETCAYPEPCRFPGKALSSMEGYGLFVTQVCRDCGVEYYYGKDTITFTSCCLFHDA